MTLPRPVSTNVVDANNNLPIIPDMSPHRINILNDIKQGAAQLKKVGDGQKTAHHNTPREVFQSGVVGTIGT